MRLLVVQVLWPQGFCLLVPSRSDVSTAVTPHSVRPPIFCTVMPVQSVLVSGCHFLHGTACRWDCLLVHFKQITFSVPRTH